MVYTLGSVEEFIATVAPFDRLSPSEIKQLAQEFNPLKYEMGQIMLVKDKIPPYISIIYEGQARYIGYDPRTSLPLSLKLISHGNVIGWQSLMRGFACETAIASTPVVALTLAREKFLNLLQQKREIKEYYQNTPGLIEIFDSLGYQLSHRATGEGNLKILSQEALKTSQVTHLEKGKINSLPPAPEGHIWCFSGGKIQNLSIGATVNPRETLEADTEIRLVSLDITLIESAHSNSVEARDNGSTPAPTENKDDPWQDNKTPSPSREQNPPVTPEILMDEDNIPQADNSILQEQPQNLFKEPKQALKSYPYFSGRSEADIGIACFRMLSKYFNIPYKGDILTRVIKQQVENNGALSLDVCGAIGELLGLTSQLVEVPAGAFARLEAPILVKLEDSLVVIYATGDKTIVVADPTLGRVREMKTISFLERWGQKGKALLLKKNKETAQQKFGLNWFIPSLIKFKWMLVEVFIASFFVQLFALANPLMIQVIIDKVIVQNSPDTLQVLGIFLVVLAVFEAILSTLRTYSFVDTTNRIDMALGSEIIDHLLRLPLRYFEKRPVGEISTRINELENIRSFLTGTALTVVLDAVFSVIYIVVMVIYSPTLTLVSMGIIPIFIVLTYIFSPLIRRQLREKAERNAETQSHLVEVMSGIQTVKAQNIELRSRWEWQERYARYVGTGFRTVITQTLAGSASNFLNQLSQLLVLWVGAYLVLQGELTLGQLIAFRIIAGYVTSPILRLAQLWQNFQQTALSLERLADIVDHPQEGEEDRDNIPMPSIEGNLKYENVCFRFKPNTPLQLNNVSIEFPAGTFVGIVGESGAGKSTLTKLVARLYEPESGRIMIDGYDVNRVELYSLRRQIGVVPQESLLFEGTIMDNIALTNPDATTEDIIEAAKIAVAHEFIMNLPNGYNTRVGERGASLSGGQRQRIAIARSVLQNPRMLILDEATSALDYNTEAQVCQNLISAFSDRTVLFITHRLGTIKNADTIVVMDKGTIVEVGSHEELMELHARYYYLYQQQLKTEV
ncbi:peptidase domain-containing ABC transporter [Cyanobacterium stanieri LEGE 03274]|uniref:Peptidase domain-containing ABC transporter n=1 Tax=Cyanobacterium stanieri LEGE 03274 TaxID=1828756 RepID=A0ABR9V2Q5_9CHRO|nr:peptidase domain-containing ABC transporter [Cyanobacterium stanieri]MBE9222179.1 peptidase domain-containing ABC transporter [Cyanobacterium stanieri LEGE 03274]